MDKLLHRRLSSRDAAVILIAVLILVGVVLFLYFRYEVSGFGNQPATGSIFKGLVLKRIQLSISEYSTQRTKRRAPGAKNIRIERFFEASSITRRPVEYLPTPTPTPLFAIPTNFALYEALQEQIRSQLEVGGIPVNLELLPTEEPGKETIRRAQTGPPGNGYLLIEIKVEHSPGRATFQINSSLYRSMQLPDSGKEIFEMPIKTLSTPRYQVQESDFRTAVFYEVEQMLQNNIIEPYRSTAGQIVQH